MRRPDPLPRRLPLAEQAIVHRAKVRDYLLDPGTSTARTRRGACRERLGYTRADAEPLRGDLLAAVREGEVIRWRLTSEGAATWSVRVTLTGPCADICPVASLWHVARPGAVPRLVSAWPEPSPGADPLRWPSSR